MLETPVSRRALLKGSGATLVGTLAWTSGPIAVIAPSRSWALNLKSANKSDGEILLQLTRHIFPHKTMEDAVYALVVKDLDAAAADDAATQKLLSEGIADLNARADGAWLNADADEQAMHTRAIAGTGFFEKVRSTAVVSLYDNDMAYAHFGYQGAAGDSGYLTKGFNDLEWLPEPPEEASGPVPGAAS